MTYLGNSVLVVVPARGGSKGISHKNLKVIGGISLVARAAKIAQALPWIDAKILSSDDPQIIAEGKQAGLDVPFIRPVDLARDDSTSADMWRHAWLESEAFYNRRFDVSILLEPTSPLRTVEDIENTLKALLSGDHLAAVTLSPIPAHCAPHKALKIGSSGHVDFFLPDGANYPLRQNVPQLLHRNGLCYAVKRTALVEMKLIIEKMCVPVVIERPVVNIDDPIDLKIAEWLLSQQT
ncbi:MAG: acylneuraminate cytidylyltransferase family protein [Cyanobacteria bacterium P01_C01_bin.70]